MEILVTDRRESHRISVEGCKSVVLAHFNYALEPHGGIVLLVNGVRLDPFDPASSLEASKKLEQRLRNGTTVEASFFLLRDAAPPEFGLVALVVHGKTVGETYDFHQEGRIREPRRISGYVRCDSLIKIVTTSKDNFNRKTNHWKDFDAKVGKAFSEWLREISWRKVGTDCAWPWPGVGGRQDDGGRRER